MNCAPSLGIDLEPGESDQAMPALAQRLVELDAAPWHGPDGAGTFYATSGTKVPTVPTDVHWMQYRATFVSLYGVADALIHQEAEPAAVAAVGQVSDDQQSVGCTVTLDMNLGEPFAALEPLPALHYRTELMGSKLIGKSLIGNLDDHQFS